MSQEYRELKDRAERMLKRRERAELVIAELGKIVSEVNTDIKVAQLQLDALAAAGDSEEQ